MADLEKTVAIIFEGVDQMGAGVDSATKRMNSIVGSAQGVVDPIANATTDILKFNAAVIASGVAVTGLAVKMAGDFDTQFREIATLIDVPIEKLGDFRSELLDYSSTSTQAMDEIMQSVYDAISNGVEYTDSLETIRLAEMAAVAGKADLSDALSAIIRPLEAYGKGMDEAESFSDMLFTTVKNGVTTLPELSSSLGDVTGLAATAGIDFNELLAAIATLTATGSSTSGAITQIQNAIANIIGPTAKATAVAEELGIEFNGAALESKGLSGLLLEVGEATGGNISQMNALFGSTQALNGMLTLTGLGAESFAENLVAMENSAGATLEAYEKMADAIGLGNQRIVNAFKVMMVGIGDPLLDEFGGIQDAIAAIFNAIGASVTSGQLQEFVGLIEGVMQSLEQTLSDVAANLPAALEAADMSGFVRGFEAVRDAISGMFSNADISTVEGLASVIATLGSGVELLGEFTAGTLTAIGPFIEKLTELAAIVLQIDPAWVAMLGVMGGGAVVLSTVLSAISALVSALVVLGGANGAVPVATKLLGGMVTVLGRLAGPTGAVLGVVYVLNDLKGKLDEFNEFRFNFSDELKAELDKTTGAQRVANEAGLFSLQKLAEGYVALSDYFGWGEEAAQDFKVFGGAGEAAALQVMDAANRMGNEAPEEIKKLSQEAINSAILIGSAATDIEGAFQSFDAPFLDQIGELPESLSRVGKLFENEGEGIAASAEAVGKALYRIQEAYEAGEIDSTKYNELKTALLGLREGADAASKGQEALAGEVLSSEEAILKAREAVLGHKLALEEIASSERIRNLEISVDFKVAKMENEAKRVEAVLNATSTTIASTAEAAASMFETLGGGGLDFSDRWLARDAIKQQLEIQQQAADQQEKLIEAQIKSLNARTQALQNGDGLIKIESDGLEPALEMIMWNVIEKVQMRANAEGAEFLLGLNGPG